MIRIAGARRSAGWAPVIAVLVGGALGCGGRSDQGGIDGRLGPDDVARVARRVEHIRGLRFTRLPEVEELTAAQAVERAKRERTQAPDDLGSEGDAGALDGLVALEDRLKLTGLIEPTDELIDLEAVGPDASGLYDPVKKRITLFAKSFRGSKRREEDVLAHELDHALEAQRFAVVRTRPLVLSDDEDLGLRSLVEGSATLLEVLYAKRYLGTRQPVSAAFTRRALTDGEETGLPEALDMEVLFPYLEGGRFAYALHRAGHGWGRIDEALAHRRPRTTSEILHPSLWLEGRRFGSGGITVDADFGSKWRQLAAAPFGELELAELYLSEVGETKAKAIASGWRAGEYELWRRRSKGDEPCLFGCHRDDALLIVARFHSARGVRAAAHPLPAIFDHSGAHRVRPESFHFIDGGYVGYALGSHTLVLAYAPTLDIIERLVPAGLNGR
jgi:hypothetical protein